MSVAEVGLEPRRSLRRSAQDQRQSSESTTAHGRKRTVDDDEAPVLVLDSSDSVKDDELEDEDDEEAGGPPPLKKVARTSGGGGAPILWKTATGAPKQLAFKKVVGATLNGSSVKSTTAAASAPPINLATALAGLLPEPTVSTFNPKRVIIKQPSAVPRLTPGPYPAPSSHLPLARRRNDKVNNEVCNDCVKALPTLRRSLGRLETRMEAVTSMIKQIVNKHSQQNVAFARPTPALVSRVPPTLVPSSSHINGNRVAGKPTAMRFVPIGGRTAVSPASPAMRKFVSEKSGPLSPSSLMYRMIARGLLIFRAAFLTVEEYYKQSPNVIKAHSLKQVQHVMADLVAVGLYKKSVSSVDTMDPECIFEKEKDLSKLARLADYGVNSADFLAGCFDD